MSDLIISERADQATVEEGDRLMPKFDQDGLIAAVVTDFKTSEVLMVGYMNEEALKRTIETGEAWYWSRSRQGFWKKGETSGQIQKVQEILTDCDQDALLIRVEVGGDGGCCHTARRAVRRPASSPGISHRRWATPARPRTSVNAALTSTSRPYGLASWSQDPIRTAALTIPESSTST